MDDRNVFIYTELRRNPILDPALQQSSSGWLLGLAILCLVLVGALVFGARFLRRARRELIQSQQTIDHLEERLKQAQRMEAVGILAGSIVHNLNNLLAVILGHARIARRETPEDSGKREDITQIIKAGTVASEMVREISDFYRQADQARKPTDLVPIVRDTLKFLRDIVPPNIEIREDLDPKCGLVLATATGVQQVLMNLCSNSMQAMFRDQGLIEVTLHREEVVDPQRAIPRDLDPGTYIKLTVRDNGRGLSRKSLDRIFESYFSGNRKRGGMGIGLSTVARILKDHDGFSVPQGRVGHGASFDIYFPMIAWSIAAPATGPRPNLTVLDGSQDLPDPLEEVADVPVPAAAPADAAREVEIPSLGPAERIEDRGRVLLVDDEEMVLRVTAAGLKKLGFEVSAHTDVRLALADFLEAPDRFDVVVTDQIMPHMSGIRLTRKIHGLRPQTPVLLITGFRDSFNEQQAREAGVRDFILKPFSHRDLAQLLDRILLRRMEGSS